jgi:hypothetical protein
MLMTLPKARGLNLSIARPLTHLTHGYTHSPDWEEPAGFSRLLLMKPDGSQCRETTLKRRYVPSWAF